MDRDAGVVLVLNQHSRYCTAKRCCTASACKCLPTARLLQLGKQLAVNKFLGNSSALITVIPSGGPSANVSLSLQLDPNSIC